ncbi:AAA family ATPase [Deinococcus arenae]|uniref:AAA family ATPase n=1 Tax=Deinococcus arenae TaxID=1452751 RepID=UPI0016691CE3|nr:AAA family ATPase [Deinococcus arenae]
MSNLMFECNHLGPAGVKRVGYTSLNRTTLLADITPLSPYHASDDASSPLWVSFHGRRVSWPDPLYLPARYIGPPVTGPSDGAASSDRLSIDYRAFQDVTAQYANDVGQGNRLVADMFAPALAAQFRHLQVSSFPPEARESLSEGTQGQPRVRVDFGRAYDDKGEELFWGRAFLGERLTLRFGLPHGVGPERFRQGLREPGQLERVVQALMLRGALQRYAGARGHSRLLELDTVLPHETLLNDQYAAAVRQVFAYFDRVGQAVRAVAAAAPSQEAPMSSSTQPSTSHSPELLNVILYGPPGTGKTYAVIDAALQRLDPDFLRSRPTRPQRQERFRALQAERRVDFVTFHQNFSYEEFVEGLRPVTTPEGAVTYELRDGVFKALALRAASPVTAGQIPDLNLQGNVWKFSLDGTGGVSAARAHCFAHGEVRLGYGECGRLDQAAELRGAPRQFFEELTQGDLVVVPGPNTAVQAIGVVTGEYRYDETPPPGIKWRNVRPVRWLAQDLNVPFKDLLGVNFTLTTLYRLKLSVPQVLAYLTQRGVPLAPAAGTPRAHVLVIDEINRGNIAKIFGELITLLEPSKRAGQTEATTVRLPASQTLFSVPDTLYLIGTMNTADRSLARLDTALRRRFDFRELPPRPDLLARTRDGIHLPKLLYAVNRRVALLLGRDFTVGHAYFMDLSAQSTVQDVARVFRTRVLPLLEEYFFDDWSRVAQVLGDPHKDPEDRIVTEEDAGAWLADHKGAARTYQVQDAALERVTAYTGIYEAGPAPLIFPPDIEAAGQDDAR